MYIAGCSSSDTAEKNTLQEQLSADEISDNIISREDGKLSLDIMVVDSESNDLENSDLENSDLENSDLENSDLENNDLENDECADNEEILDFVDVYQKHYQTPIYKEIEKHNYQPQLWQHEGHKLAYNDLANYDTRLGVDVSHHQGNINWQKVKDAGYDFAFLRIAYRGYGKEGKLLGDREFESNYRNARAAGLDVGVYIFSQAINEAEAKEEADFVLNTLNNRELQLPVVYDPESILDDVARTDNVSGEQFTRNTRVFSNAIKEAGYEPMIYSNMLWEAFEFDLKQLQDLEIWYADYEKIPQTPYHFSFWQYTNEGMVDGISGATDINIQMIKR